MELNWSTFVLEMINFLVLLWILKRFLYRPVLDVIEARRKSIEDGLAEARRIEDEARALKSDYDGRVARLEAERSEAREKLAREIEQARARRLSDLAAELAQEREKARVANERRLAEQRRAAELQALRHGAAFSSRLLERAAGPELEARLLDLLIGELQGLSDTQRARLHDQWGGAAAGIEVSSAYPLSDAQRERLASALRDAGAASAPLRFRRDAELVAGLRVVIGAWVLAVNVRDELQGFTEFARGTR